MQRLARGSYERLLDAFWLVLLIAAPQVAGAAQIFDVVADFSTAANPNGTWSYGSSTTLGGTFAPLVASGCDSNASILGWASSAAGLQPYVFANTSPGTLNCGGGRVAPSLLDLHPGPTGEFAIVRWTAPSDGFYLVAGSFQGIDFLVGTTTDVHVLINGGSVFDGNVGTFGVPLSFNIKQTLSKNDTLDFAVGYGPNNDFHNDSTGLVTSVQEAPEPGSVVLLGTGLALWGASRLRRSARG